jgi:hypothetical protein
MPYKTGLFATSALLAALIGTDAYAQQRPAAAATTTIEELVVTAEKREQNLQDVPVAVSAFTDNKRELVGINSIQDMTNFTPGLTYNSSTDRVSLRGVGRLTNVLSGDASVANYNDGVYETFAVQAGRSTLFLDRVEVLRGPQGTLYGRNAIGGAINEISKRPTEDWYAEARATYENYNHYILEAAVSGPVPFYDKLQWRLAGDWDRQTDGWAKSTIPGAPDEGNVINEWFLEAQLQGKFFDDKLEFWAKYGQGVWHNGAGGPGSGSGGWLPPAPLPHLRVGLPGDPAERRLSMQPAEHGPERRQRLDARLHQSGPGHPLEHRAGDPLHGAAAGLQHRGHPPHLARQELRCPLHHRRRHLPLQAEWSHIDGWRQPAQYVNEPDHVLRPDQRHQRPAAGGVRLPRVQPLLEPRDQPGLHLGQPATVRLGRLLFPPDLPAAGVHEHRPKRPTAVVRSVLPAGDLLLRNRRRLRPLDRAPL